MLEPIGQALVVVAKLKPSMPKLGGEPPPATPHPTHTGEARQGEARREGAREREGKGSHGTGTAPWRAEVKTL